MKTLKTKFLLVLLMTLGLSCSKDDDTPQITSPTFTYSNTTISAIFFQNGNSTAPTVNWNGNQGAFSMANSINGLSIDANTGVVSWTKILPAGNHNIEVIAGNSAGQTSSNLTLENPLQGLFVGNYNGTAYFKVDFYTDGTVAVTSDDPTSAPQFSGTWTLTGNEVLVNFTADSDPTIKYSLKGNLVQTSASVTYSGTLYTGHNAIPGNELFSFNVVLN